MRCSLSESVCEHVPAACRGEHAIIEIVDCVLFPGGRRGPIATSASTATGVPSGRILIGLISISRTLSFRTPISPRATRIRASASRSAGGWPRKAWRILAVRMVSIISRASPIVRGATRKTASSMSSVKIPPRPNMTQGPNRASRVRPQTSSRSPRTISWTRRPSQPAMASRRRASSRISASDFRFRATAPSSVLCWIRSPAAFSTTGKPISSAASIAAASSATKSSRLTGMPKPARNRFASYSLSAALPPARAAEIRFIRVMPPFGVCSGNWISPASSPSQETHPISTLGSQRVRGG